MDIATAPKVHLKVARNMLTRFPGQFVYTYQAAGVMIILLTILHAICKRTGWTRFNIFRSFVVGAVGLNLSILSFTSTDKAAHNLAHTPWPLPLLCLAFVLVLCITYLPHPSKLLDETHPSRFLARLFKNQKEPGSSSGS